MNFCIEEKKKPLVEVNEITEEVFSSEVPESHWEPVNCLSREPTTDGSEGISHLLGHHIGIPARGVESRCGEHVLAWQFAKIFLTISSFDCLHSSWEVGMLAIVILSIR